MTLPKAVAHFFEIESVQELMKEWKALEKKDKEELKEMLQEVGYTIQSPA